MASITSQNMAQAILKIVASNALDPLMGNLIMGNLVNRAYEPVLAKAGDTVNIPIPPTLVANNISETGSVSTQNPSIGNAQLVLNTHAEATFQIPDITAVLVGADSGSFDLLKLYMEPAIIALSEKVETDLLSLYPNLTANTAVGTGNTTITEATFDAAERTLFDAKVPVAERKFAVVSSQAYSDIRQIPRFTEMQTSGNGSAISTGQVGRLKDFDIFRSQFVQKPSTTTYNLAFARNALGLVTRRLPQPIPGTGAIAEYVEMGNFGFRIVMSYDPNTLAQQFTVDILYGTGVLRSSFGVPLLT
jgi:hypothetical protein